MSLCGHTYLFYMPTQPKNRNIVLIVSKKPNAGPATDLLNLKQEYNSGLRIALLHEKAPQNKVQEKALNAYDITIQVNFDKPKQIVQALQKYEGELLAATARGEGNLFLLRKLIPFIPYLKTPTVESLRWATDKLEMRRRFMAYDKSITPRYMSVKDAKKTTIQRIEERVGFPLIVKPTGLASSLLVSKAYHHEELEKALKKTFRKINTLTKDYKGKEEPRVLVEQFLEGSMYSIDAYVSSRGALYFCPLVSVKTGNQIGFDDFFGYQRLTPVTLRKSSIERAQDVTRKAVHALGLRSTTVHVELMRTDHGWKVIEVGPRIGGFRHEMYELSYGIDHFGNDVLVRIPRKPNIPKKELGHTAVFQFFPDKPGIIKTLKGVKKIKELDSFYKITLNKKVGDRSISAANGGKSVMDVVLFHEDRPKLLADVRRMETLVKIETKTSE